MMRTLIVGDPVVHLGDEPLIADGAIVVEDGKVADVGARARLESGTFDETLGGPGYFVMPGFVNCHYHSECALVPGVYDLIFERANIRIHGSLFALAEDDLYHAILANLLLLIRGGQTAAIDMYYGRPGMELFGAEPALRAYRDAGMRVAFGLVTRDQNTYVDDDDEAFRSCLPARLADELHALPIGYAWPADDVLAATRRLAARWDGHDQRIRIIAAPDWTPACSDSLYRATAGSPTSWRPA